MQLCLHGKQLLLSKTDLTEPQWRKFTFSGGGRQSLWQNFLISAYPAPLLALEKDVLALFQVTISKVTEISATAE